MLVPVHKEVLNLLSGKEVDGEASLRSGQVADGETAIGRLFDGLMSRPNVGSNGIDPEAEEAPGATNRWARVTLA